MPKTALVTGSAGFIGRHMVRELRGRGWVVDESDINHPDDYWGIGFLEIAADPMLFAPQDRRYDLVVHAAYHVGGRAGIDGTNTNFARNVQLDSSLFEWAVRTGQKRVLYFSSSAVYPKRLQMPCTVCDNPHCQEGPGPLREEMASTDLDGDDWGWKEPDANYGFAKLVGERLAEDARANGLNVSVVRAFSGYGEDQSLDYPFPAILQRARAGDLSVYGPPGQTRDWVYVSDVVQGALAVVESETVDPVNLCTGVATEMGELAKAVMAQARPAQARIWPEEPTYDETKPTGVFYRVGNPDRMLKYYTPKVSLEEGIRRALQK